MDEPGLRLSGVVALAVLPLLVALGWLTSTRFDTPSDGTVTGRTTPGWHSDGIIVDEVYRAGSPLRAGDVVVSLDGIGVDRLARGHHRFAPQVGDVVVYRVERAEGADAAVQMLDLPVRLTRYPLAAGIRAHWAVLPLAVTMYAVATFVVVRRPRQPAARALYAITVLLPVTSTSFPLGAQVLEVVSGPLWPYVVGDLANCLVWGALLHFALVFPEPPASLSRWRSLVAAAYLSPFALYAVRLALSMSGTPGPLPRLQLLTLVSQPAAYVHPFAVGIAMVAGYRRRHGDDLARRRMRWAFVAFATAAVAYIGLGQGPSRVWGRPLVPWDWMVLLFIPFPVALGLAVLRYRLFDIQIILRRSLVFGALTAALGGLYLLVVTASSRLVHLPSAVAPFVASLAVALLFGPLRTRVHRLVSRALFGDRDDPFEVMDRLSQRLEATVSADSALASLVETLTETLRLSYAAITLRGADTEPVRYGVPSGSTVRVPIIHAGEQVGDLEIDAGPGREPFGVADQRLLDGLARQVGVISQNLLLETRLRTSLERTVTAREEERRRLRRDLHDGLGPTLAAVGFQAELAGSLVGTDPQRARQLLAGLGAAQREAVADLRRLVDGLRPPVLDRLGLVGALRERAAVFGSDAATAAAFDDGVSVPVVVVDAGPDVEPLPAAVEVAAFRIAQEALTNVVRHANARHCVVRLRRDAAALVVEVEDDGCGLSLGFRAGVGLGAIRERAVELGGSATVSSGPDGGTLVRARLPVRT